MRNTGNIGWGMSSTELPPVNYITETELAFASSFFMQKIGGSAAPFDLTRGGGAR